MKIVINPYDSKSIAQAEKLVQQYKKDFEQKVAEFVRRLAEIGVSVASAGFSMADYDGVNDVAVSMEKTETGYRVIASGETVGFIEFGTGKNYPEWDRSYDAGFEISYEPPKHGTFGKLQGKNDWGWWFQNHAGVPAQHTYGNQPAEAMLSARNQIIEQVTRIAREVWQ
jgi:hypothetical protein